MWYVMGSIIANIWFRYFPSHTHFLWELCAQNYATEFTNSESLFCIPHAIWKIEQASRTHSVVAAEMENLSSLASIYDFLYEFHICISLSNLQNISLIEPTGIFMRYSRTFIRAADWLFETQNNINGTVYSIFHNRFRSVNHRTTEFPWAWQSWN